MGFFHNDITSVTEELGCRGFVIKHSILNPRAVGSNPAWGHENFVCYYYKHSI